MYDCYGDNSVETRSILALSYSKMIDPLKSVYFYIYKMKSKTSN